MKSITKQAYQLMHEGILALAEIERNGICIDIEYCEKAKKELHKKIEAERTKLYEFEEVKQWKRRFGVTFNLESSHQLAKVLYEDMGCKPSKMTENENPSVDQFALESIDHPMIRSLLRIRQLEKTKSTYLGNIVRETVNRKLHPFFNLHTVKTFRSSSQDPNFQNIPVRDPEIKEIVRRAFIPRPGHRIGGSDYKGIEVRVACLYHQDPSMLKYLNDPASDMHRDVSMDCYMIEDTELVTKNIRYCGKNKFTFPEFYGDYYKNCAKALWDAISQMGLKLTDGTPLKEHLRDKGIKSYQRFERHIEDVEYRFWNEKFPVYKQWKEDWYRAYEKKGYFDTLTGFRCSGVMEKNDVVNYPVQGVAFHCLLWSLIQLQRWMKQEKLRSKIIGQVHDEITKDLHNDEFMYVLRNERKIMCEDIKEHWIWLKIVPLDIAVSFAGVDRPWNEAEEEK
mgnify:CR=1 FL=1